MLSVPHFFVQDAMKPVAHILLTAPLAGVVAWQAGLVPAAVLYGGAVLIDVDHFIFYVQRTGHYDPVAMFSWYDRADAVCTSRSYYGVSIFHVAEVFVLLALATPVFPLLFWFLLGMAYHMFLDYYWLFRHPVLSVRTRPLSLIEHLIRRKRGEREFWRDTPVR